MAVWGLVGPVGTWSRYQRVPGTVRFCWFVVRVSVGGRGVVAAAVSWRCSGGAAGAGSAEADAFDGDPCGEEPVQGRGVVDQPHGDPTPTAPDHGGDWRDVVHAAPELHAEVVAPVGL